MAPSVDFGGRRDVGRPRPDAGHLAGAVELARRLAEGFDLREGRDRRGGVGHARQEICRQAEPHGEVRPLGARRAKGL